MTVRGKGEPGFAKGRAFVVDDRGQRNPFEDIPPGSVLIAKTISLSDSVMIDFKKVVGMVTEEEDYAGHVGLLSRGLGIPAVVGVGGHAVDLGHRIESPWRENEQRAVGAGLKSHPLGFPKGSDGFLLDVDEGITVLEAFVFHHQFAS